MAVNSIIELLVYIGGCKAEQLHLQYPHGRGMLDSLISWTAKTL